ncbi:MAG: hypothetical protein COA41_18235 [Sphingopyxis sp.]|nr:MAG: hypothetical protein COA41_18235 [Sphingopyxis sp.]
MESVDNVAVAANAAAIELCEIRNAQLREPIRIEVSRTLCDSYRKQISRLQKGGYSLTVPEVMQWKSTTKVSLIMAKQVNESVLEPTDADSAIGQVYTGEIAISRYMFAELVDRSNSFKITSNSPKVVDVEEDPTPSWEWNVSANKLGKHNITVRMGIQLTDARGNKSRYFPLERRTITVSPGFIQRGELFFQDLARVFVAPKEAIEELIALFGLLGALGVAYWAFRKDWRAPTRS